MEDFTSTKNDMSDCSAQPVTDRSRATVDVRCDLERLRVRERGIPYGEAPAGPTRRVRVEVDVKEELLEAVRERYHLSSRRAAIEFALRRVAVRPMSNEEALGMEGVGWDGNLEAMRSGDPGAPW